MLWYGISKKIKNFFIKKRWDNRKIAFVSILIAVAVAFILLMTSILPFLIWPSMRISIGGLPIKLTGYIFGPFIGTITGIVSDSITFAFRPIYWHWTYFLTSAATGLIAGFFGYFMNRRWKSNEEWVKKTKEKLILSNFIITWFILVMIIVSATVLITIYGDAIFDKEKIDQLPKSQRPLVTNKWVFLGIAVSGIGTMCIGLIIMLFTMKRETLNNIVPIVAFSAILEVTGTPLIALGDITVLGAKGDNSGFITVLSTHFLFSPVKIWINLIVVYTAYRIISPLIFNKTANGWN